MKTTNALLLTLLLTAGAPARAEVGTWDRLVITATTEVNRWVTYWRGEAAVVPTPTSASAPTSTATPAGPAAGQNGTAVATATAPAAPSVDLAVAPIERIAVTREKLISREDFRVPGTSLTPPSEMIPLAKPASVVLGAVKVTPAFGVRGVQGNLKTVGQLIDRAAVDKIVHHVADVREIKPKAYQPLSEERLKMVAAKILFDAGGHCHLAMGLFNALSTAPTTRTEAEYHLGACAATLKMGQVSFDHLGRVVTARDPDFAKDALARMALAVTPAREQEFFTLVSGTKGWESLVEPKSADLIHYRMAKGAFRARDFKTARTQANLAKGEFANDALYLTAMTEFALNDRVAARKTLETLSATLEKSPGTDSNLRALTALNLARIDFAAEKFTAALDNYQRVPKDHPLWVQGLIEQGWAQVATEDFAGAIGNMYSLHSPYFRAVYQPESFAVRTIGYLNMCQYGDAYRALSQLEKEYREFEEKTARYLDHREPAAVYASARQYIQGKSTSDVDGVPFQVWREMAHRRDFLNLQTALNEQIDESGRYGGVNQKIKTEKASIRAKAEAAKVRFDNYRAKIAAFGKDPARAAQRKDYEASQLRERDHVIGYRFQLTTLEQSRQGYLTFQAQAGDRLRESEAMVTKRAGTVLLGHAQQMRTEMARVLANNELLRYEVFSGSGENIRYQVAGGKVGNANRIPASIKPAKMMNWNFDGEFWEDEIGSYRSGLQNNCATTVPNQAKHQPDEE